MENWKKELESFFKEQRKIQREHAKKIGKKRLEIEKFYQTVVHPTFQELKTELKKYVKAVNLNLKSRYAEIIVEIDKERKYRYEIVPRISRTPEHDVLLLAADTCITPESEESLKKTKSHKRKKVSQAKPAPRNFNFLPMKRTVKTEIIEHFINGYKKATEERIKQIDANFELN